MTDLSLHPRPVVSPIPPFNKRPSRCRVLLLTVSLSSLNTPDFGFTDVASMMDKVSTFGVWMRKKRYKRVEAILNLSAATGGSGDGERPGFAMSFELGDNNPSRTIRCLYNEDQHIRNRRNTQIKFGMLTAVAYVYQCSSRCRCRPRPMLCPFSSHSARISQRRYLSYLKPTVRHNH